MSAAAEWEVALSLGSNLGERRRHLAGALRALEDGLLHGMRVSSLWETRAVEVGESQPDYLNLCVVGVTEHGPEALLSRCQALEAAAGRSADSHLRPRPLDLDLLFHGAAPFHSEEPAIPHPRMKERRFVLAPLAELRPNWRHPGTGRSVREMLAGLGDGQALRKLRAGKDWWQGDH
jgi:2-amino-4-hydroxy-6-hydroxymethyldihydropteridine diphosphokinase